MGAATKILGTQVDETNEEISRLNERIKVLEQEMISVKEFMKEALVQGKCPPGQSCNQGGRLVQMASDAEGSRRGAEKIESDRSRGPSTSKTASTPEEMGGNGGEEGGFKKLTEAEFNYKMKRGLCVLCDKRYRKNHECRYKNLRLLVVKDEDCSRGPSTSKTVSTPKEMGRNGGEEGGVKTLTQAQFNYKMKKGLCLRCDKRYRKNHECRYKNLRLLVVKDEDCSRGPSTSKTVSTPNEMGGNGGEEGGFKKLTEAEFNYKMKKGLCVLCDKRYRKNHECRYKNLRLLVVKDEDCSRGPSTSKTVSTPKEMGGNGGEEGGFKTLTQAQFNYKMTRGLCLRCDKRYCKNHECRYKNLRLLVVKDEDCSRGPSTSKTVSTPNEMGGNGGEEGGFKALTQAQFNSRMKRGLCVRCDKRYRNHKCRNKNWRLLVVEDEDVFCDQEKKEKEEEPETVTGGANQFKFLGKIGDREVIVLFGTAATHNFISRKLVNALQIPLERTRKFMVNKGPRGSEVSKRVVLKTQGIEIIERFFPTHIEIADVVLGTEWLKSLGRATLQGNPMTLTFPWHGKTVTLQADPSLSRRDQPGDFVLEWI